MNKTTMHVWLMRDMYNTFIGRKPTGTHDDTDPVQVLLNDLAEWWGTFDMQGRRGVLALHQTVGEAATEAEAGDGGRHPTAAEFLEALTGYIEDRQGDVLTGALDRWQQHRHELLITEAYRTRDELLAVPIVVTR